MNTIRMIPLANALKLEILNGLSQGCSGCRCPGGACPVPTLTRATMDRTNSMVSSMPSRIFWKFADTSMPT